MAETKGLPTNEIRDPEGYRKTLQSMIPRRGRGRVSGPMGLAFTSNVYRLGKQVSSV